MGRHVDCPFLISLLNQFYIDQEKNCNFCLKRYCRFSIERKKIRK